MVELDFSCFAIPAAFELLTAEFGAQNGCRVKISQLGDWAELLRRALHKQLPDVIEIGSTWLGALGNMHCLRPFTADEVAAAGGADAFAAGAWQSCLLPNDSRVWALPLTIDPRLFIYRRDFLEQAGVDETAAFATHAAVEQTLQQLQKLGDTVLPWAAPTIQPAEPIQNLQLIVNWIWGAGGDLLNVERRQILFHKTEALNGMTAYYNLRRYMTRRPPFMQAIREYSAAVIAGGTWTILPLETVPPPIRDKLGMAPMPGSAFVGGSHLVVSRSSKNAELAARLAIFLTSAAAQLHGHRVRGSLPTSLAALNSDEFQTAPFSSALIEAIRRGRSLPGNFSLWGLLEERLTAALAQIWRTLLEQPQADTAAVIRNIIMPLAQRQQMIIDQERPRPLPA